MASIGIALPQERVLGDAALVEQLDRARVQPARAGDPASSWSRAADDDGLDACQRELGCQHEPRRTSSRDHHRMLRHGGDYAA